MLTDALCIYFRQSDKLIDFLLIQETGGFSDVEGALVKSWMWWWFFFFWSKRIDSDLIKPQLPHPPLNYGHENLLFVWIKTEIGLEYKIYRIDWVLCEFTRIILKLSLLHFDEQIVQIYARFTLIFFELSFVYII